MGTMELSAELVCSLEKVEKPTLIYDADLKGLGLRIMPPSSRNACGARSWILEYRPGAGSRRTAKKRVTLGSTEHLTEEQARAMARELLVRSKTDAEQTGAGPLRTLADLSSIYREETDAIRKAGTVVLYGGYWENHILPALGTRVAARLERHDVVRLHRKIGTTNKTTANRVLGLLSHFYTWAAAAGYLPIDCHPCRSIDKFRECGRERFLSQEELARLGAALQEAETRGIVWAREAAGRLSKHAPKAAEHRRTKIDPDAADAIRMLLFTGARLREILHLQWPQYDRQRGLLLLPDSKTGRKTIVLGQHAAETLERVWQRAVRPDASAKALDKPASVYVFPAQQPRTPRADLKRPWAMLVREAELPGVRIHDLRHSFASIGVSAQLGLPVIGGLLGHASPQTTERYAHLAAAPLRSAADLICGNIQAALTSGVNNLSAGPQQTSSRPALMPFCKLDTRGSTLRRDND